MTLLSQVTLHEIGAFRSLCRKLTKHTNTIHIFKKRQKYYIMTPFQDVLSADEQHSSRKQTTTTVD